MLIILSESTLNNELVVTSINYSFPMVEYSYAVTGLSAGANIITLPTPPAAGSFPPLNDWIPTFVYAFPYNFGAVGSLCTVDPSSITSTAGAVTFTLYAGAATDCRIMVQ